MSAELKIIECPRDAMQGLDYFIPTGDKIKYLNALLKVGFHTLDFGSFVSTKAIPQMVDTVEVLENLDLSASPTKLLAIVANLRGVDEALKHKVITYIGYPFSISETFQKRNTNSDINTSLSLVDELVTRCGKAGKTPVIYLSMAFGNPYGEKWNIDLVNYWFHKLTEKGARIISLSDTVGIATPELIFDLYQSLNVAFPNSEIGLHLHSTPDTVLAKIEAAYASGCLRFDSAIKGYGGCPMAADKLTGNIATEKLVEYLLAKRGNLSISLASLADALELSKKIFRPS